MSEKKYIYKFWYLWLCTHKKNQRGSTNKSLKKIKFRTMDGYERLILPNH